MSEFIKFAVPDDLKVLQEETIKKISKSGKIKIGINEVTKTIERGNAKFILIAEDVSPVEIVMHIPIISKEKKVPFSYVKTKDDLGKMVGISAKASCVAILDAGSLQKELSSLLDKIAEISGDKKAVVKEEKPKVEKPKTEKPKVEAKPKAEVKEEKVKAEVKEEKPKAEVKEEKPKAEEAKAEVKEEKPKAEEAKAEVKEEKVKAEEEKAEENKE